MPWCHHHSQIGHDGFKKSITTNTLTALPRGL